jgi:hypothetical protein
MANHWRSTIIGLAFIAPACGPQMDTAEAEAEIGRFRKMYEGAEFDRIYASAADELRAASPAPQFTKFLSLIRRRFGNVRVSNQVGWHTNFAPGGTAYVLNYDTQFERGRAAEQFVLKVADGRARLMGYHVNSPELMNELLEQSVARIEGDADPALERGSAEVPVTTIEPTRPFAKPAN